MTTTDVAVHDGGSRLAITDDQTGFTDAQRTALLASMNIHDPNVPQATLDVFFHRCQVMRLDPFTGQAYLIGRKDGQKKNRDGSQKYSYTMQTGIDGFRVTGQRLARDAQEAVSVLAPEWMGDSGQWVQAWSTHQWGAPIAARVTIRRGDDTFTSVCNYDEYVQTVTWDGQTKPNSMWSKMPANQLAKCAEAASWRKAYPNDLGGVYVDAEMGQADNGEHGSGRVRRRRRVAAATFEPAPATPDDEVVEGEHVQGDDEPSQQAVQEMMSAFDVLMTHPMGTDEGVAERRDYMSRVAGRQITSPADLTAVEVAAVVDRLRADAAQGDAS